ncbi:DUF397 domain-containing protein [Micromonospora tulbaghiae]|uniref:DUF397 domain-containing protein n=1 Tax=Micromonospora tulbaghiae TaxID=479978 RepID=UPI000B81838C
MGPSSASPAPSSAGANSNAPKVRSSKDRAGGTLAFEPAAWQRFVSLAKVIGASERR